MALEIGTIDRRTGLLMLVAAVMVVIAIVHYSGSGSGDTVIAQTDSIPTAENRLRHLRLVAATVPGKEELVRKAQAELADREKGMLRADTEQQAQTQLLEITQAIARSNGIDVRGMQQFSDKVLSDDYAEISDTIAFTCGIEQLVNFLSALGNQPQILATNEVRVTGGNDKNKNVQVRLSVSAIVARKLIPKKGTTSF